jgi:hypothetical protein
MDTAKVDQPKAAHPDKRQPQPANNLLPIRVAGSLLPTLRRTQINRMGPVHFLLVHKTLTAQSFSSNAKPFTPLIINSHRPTRYYRKA